MQMQVQVQMQIQIQIQIQMQIHARLQVRRAQHEAREVNHRRVWHIALTHVAFGRAPGEIVWINSRGRMDK